MKDFFLDRINILLEKAETAIEWLNHRSLEKEHEALEMVRCKADEISREIMEMETAYIYTITTIKDDEGLTRRVPGFFFTLEEAQDAVTKNRNDIHESCYKYAVIEETPPGIYGDLNFRTEWWYVWEPGKYRQIQKPAKFVRTIYWGMG